MLMRCLLPALALPMLLAGCGGPAQPDAAARGEQEEAQVRANFAKLTPEDRQLAEQQKFCAVESDNRLGAMGVPVKVMVEGEPVFLCCEHCQKKALARPERTLDRVKALRAGAADTPNK
jgi:hypothetical protein